MSRLTLALALSAVLAGGARAQGGAAATPAVGQIEGKVVAAGTGEPLAGVTVSVHGTARSDVTNAGGGFRITEVPAGEALVIARIVGREPARLTVAVVAGETARADFTLGAVTMPPVVVSATRTTTTLEEMPLHATVIAAADLQRAPAQTLDQVLRGVSGMNVAGAPFYTTDPTGHQAKMRGVTSNASVLVLLDGIPIHDPFFSTTQWFKVPLSAIDHVEVVRGGNSSLWGNQAVAGVMNVITKKPVRDGAEFGVTYGSLNTAVPSAALTVRPSAAFSLRAYGDLLTTDGYQTTPPTYLSSFPGKSASSALNGNAQLALYYSPASTFNAFWRGGYHHQDQNIGGYDFGTNLQQDLDMGAGFTKLFAAGGRADVRLWGQYLTFAKENGAGCYLASAVNCNTTATAAPLVQYANSRDSIPSHELGGSAILSSREFGGWLGSVQAGVDYRLVSGQDSAWTYNKPTTTDGSSATINRINYGGGRQQFVGVFSQVRLVPIARLEATVSVRYDYWANQDGVAQMTKYTAGAPGPTSGGPIADSHWSAFDPSVSARYSLPQHVSLRGAVYRSFRAPGLNNLYRSFSSTTSITVANPNLSPSTLTGGEVGLDFQTRKVTVGVTWFQQSTKALITSYKVPNAAAAPPPVTAICGANLSNCPATVNFNTNGQDAVSRGLEFVTTVRPARFLSVDGAYTYTGSHYTATTTGDPIDVQLGAIPEHLATLGVTCDVTSRWNTYVGVRYSSAMYLDVNQTIRQPAYGLLDISTSYRVGGELDVYAAAVNVTDVQYADNATTSASSQTLGMPRTLTGGVRWRW
ncbi:MAG TPA: TonB-dependent receptor [Gemmatimonadales bacterium]|nr:TonB-dependent receptor [Gemmatimonadales bacterium]